MTITLRELRNSVGEAAVDPKFFTGNYFKQVAQEMQKIASSQLKWKGTTKLVSAKTDQLVFLFSAPDGTLNVAISLKETARANSPLPTFVISAKFKGSNYKTTNFTTKIVGSRKVEFKPSAAATAYILFWIIALGTEKKYLVEVTKFFNKKTGADQ